MKQFTVLASFLVKAETRDDAIELAQALIDEADLGAFSIEAAGAATYDAMRGIELLSLMEEHFRGYAETDNYTAMLFKSVRDHIKLVRG